MNCGIQVFDESYLPNNKDLTATKIYMNFTYLKDISKKV